MTDPLQDPGVQGLAQLGRNAIERVAQLEAELAGYVEANRHMKGELDDALEDARKYAEAQREIARLIDANRHHDEIVGEQSAQIVRLRDALTEVMSWIDNWDANFTQDDEWPETEEKSRAALAKVSEAPK